jgi:fatty-acyl-CoA synthase
MMRGLSFGAVLESSSRRFATRTALSDGERDWTYAEAIGLVRAHGRALREAGLRAGDRVGFLVGDTPELAFALYGALWAGITVVPLNVRLSVSDHTYMLEDADARGLVVDAAHLEHGAGLVEALDLEIVLGSTEAAAAGIDGARALDGLAAGQSHAPDSIEEAVDPGAVIWIQYTGGTTGRPKGALHTHETMLSAFLGCALEFDIAPDEVCALVTPLTHSGTSMFFPVWMRGGTNVLLGGFDPERLARTIEARGVTSTLMVPTMISALLDSGALAGASLETLRTIVYGASPIARPLLERAIDSFGPILIQGYGQTEAFSQIAVLDKVDHALAIGPRPELLGAAGRPVAIADVRIADEDLAILGTGEIGEVVVRGPHVFRGYRGKPRETAETLVDGWLRTGDVGRLDEDGYLHLLDRKGDVIITGGFNVYSKEVETVLDDHPAVAQACVIGVPDEKWGEAVTAVVVLEEEAEEAAIIEYVKSRKGSVQAPKSVQTVDALPRTSLGKVDKAAIRARYWSDRERAVN